MPRISSHRSSHRFGIFVILGALLIATGCMDGTGDDLTVTEKKRLEVGPRVARFLLEGQRAYERGSYNTALAMTDSVAAIAPDLADLHYLRGSIYAQLNQVDIARAAFRTVLELDKEYPRARYNLGLLSSRMGNLREAIDWFKEENELDRDSNVLLELGRAYVKLGEPDSARMAYEASLDLDESNSTTYMWLGQLYEELGQLDKALETSKKGLALRPEDPDYQYIVGSLLSRMGRDEEALEYLRYASTEQPWHHGAQVNMGQVLMRLGREAEAQPYFAQADSAQQLNQRIADAEQAANLQPHAIEHWIELGTLLRKAGEIEKAIDALKVAVTLHPTNMNLQGNLALLQMENGDLDLAIERYSAIVRLDSSLAGVWLNLGAAHANAGHPAQARRAWEKVLELEPGHPIATSYLARVSDISSAP